MSSPPDPTAPIDTAPTLNVDQGRAFFGGSEEVHHRALGQFADLYSPGVRGARDYTAHATSASALALRRELHSIAGAAAAIGAGSIATQAGELGDALTRDPSAPACATLLFALENALAALVRAIQQAR
ncbi:MAG: Hpt domain-containing protein [Pseudomonadota bacterium]|nr:Hpt domain-containing protein [Pseudomonadota bacterium]